VQRFGLRIKRVVRMQAANEVAGPRRFRQPDRSLPPIPVENSRRGLGCKAISPPQTELSSCKLYIIAEMNGGHSELASATLCIKSLISHDIAARRWRVPIPLHIPLVRSKFKMSTKRWVKRAYRRTDVLGKPRQLMRAWTEYCEGPAHDGSLGY
jgi:hypothetical protein